MSIVVSAPGKVLIAGGYLVLDPKYSGIVVSTSSRFYTIIRKGTSASRIRVRSPQFINGEWEATVKVDHHQVILEENDSTKAISQNKFVYLAIQKVLLLVLEMEGESELESGLSLGLDVTIVGDNDFYSQRAQLSSRKLPYTLESLNQLPPFAPSNVTLGDVHKTGLGSSAALITSLVTALLMHFTAISAASLSTTNPVDRSLAHNVAQYVHCLAQGKVGSGFDVSSAVFGSHLYSRFDPGVIAPLMSDTGSDISLMSVLSPSNHQWNHTVKPFRLPPLMRLMLGDVDAGSDTPSLVGKVLQWKREKSTDAKKMWDSLSELNQELASVLTALVEQHGSDPETYQSIITRATTLPFSKPAQWVTMGITQIETNVVDNLVRARAIAENIRAYMRQMGTASGVPIEPPEQTRLLDACMSQVGVIAGGVPGAGGYDAIWLLVLNSHSTPDSSPVSLIESVWSSWKELNVSPLSAVENGGRGIRVEKLEAIPGLLDSLR